MGQLERAFGYIDGGVMSCLFLATTAGGGGFKNGTRS